MAVTSKSFFDLRLFFVNKLNSAMEEFYFRCPYCNASVSILIEPTPGRYHYIEDCEVCCSPITFRYIVLVTSQGEVAVRQFSATTDEEL